MLLLLGACGPDESPRFSIQRLALGSNQEPSDSLEPQFEPIDSVEVQLLVSDYVLVQRAAPRWQPIATAQARTVLPEESSEQVVGVFLELLDSFQLARENRWLVPGNDLLPYFAKLGAPSSTDFWSGYLQGRPRLLLHDPWELRLLEAPAHPQALRFLAAVQLSDGRRLETNEISLLLR